MDIIISISAEAERAVNHILAYNRLHGADLNTTAQQYIQAELENKVNHLLSMAAEKRRLYIQETFSQLSGEQIANVAEYIYGITNP